MIISVSGDAPCSNFCFGDFAYGGISYMGGFFSVLISSLVFRRVPFTRLASFQQRVRIGPEFQ